jgi:hypothetical protein
MATLERRIENLEQVNGPVEKPRVILEFVDPQRGIVFAEKLAEILSRNLPEGDEAKMFLDGVDRLKSSRLENAAVDKG